MGASAIDTILDPENTDNIVMYDEEGEALEFEQIAVLPLDGELYAILRPIDPEFEEEMDEDEALVFKVEEVDGEDTLALVEDDDVVDAVFEEFYAMLEE